MFYCGNYFNNPFMMNFSMLNYSFNSSMFGFSPFNFSFNSFMPSFNTGNFNYGLLNSYASFNPTTYTMPSLFGRSTGFSTLPTLPTFPGGSSTNIFGFLNYSSISAASAASASTSRSEDTVRRASLNVSTKGLGPEFLAKVKQVAKNLNCDYKDLLAVMNAESGLKGDAWNGTTAVGLIQFTSLSVADLNKRYGLNLTKEKIAAMPEIEQLDLVEKYLKIAKGYGGFSENEKLTAGDLYAIVFLPGRAGRDVLCTKGEKGKNGKLLGYYESNPIDLNGDNKITKSELAQRVYNFSVNESIFA